LLDSLLQEKKKKNVLTLKVNLLMQH